MAATWSMVESNVITAEPLQALYDLHQVVWKCGHWPQAMREESAERKGNAVSLCEAQLIMSVAPRVAYATRWNYRLFYLEG